MLVQTEIRHRADHHSQRRKISPNVFTNPAIKPPASIRISPTYDHSGKRFSPENSRRRGAPAVLLRKQKMERGLLRRPVSGYASVYNMNTRVQCARKRRGRQVSGAQG